VSVVQRLYDAVDRYVEDEATGTPAYLIYRPAAAAEELLQKSLLYRDIGSL
jgi:hypothetical protein